MLHLWPVFYRFLYISFFHIMKSFPCPKKLIELNRAGDEGADGTQHALIEGKVHIPRSLHCLPDRDNESKITHHCSFITRWALGPF